MPLHLTSAASDTANMEMKALVAAYCTEKGLGMTAEALLVYTKQPRSFFSICRQEGRWRGQWLETGCTWPVEQATHGLHMCRPGHVAAKPEHRPPAARERTRSSSCMHQLLQLLPAAGAAAPAASSP
jgi:hypothetical protein